MSKTNKLNKLFEGWKASLKHLEDRKHFNRDGIICESCWGKKILFILKEPHGNQESSDLRETIRYILTHPDEWQKDKQKYQTLRRLGIWFYGLINTSKNDVPLYDKASEEGNIKNGLRSSAIINLKKRGGGSRTELKGFKEWVLNNNKEFLPRELGIIEPNIVICGYTFFKGPKLSLERLLDVKLTPVKGGWNYDRNSNEYWWYKTENNIYFLDFWHPIYRTKENYKKLCELYQKLLINKSKYK